MNDTERQAALQRITAAITARDATGCRIAFDPRKGDRDPTPDLAALGIDHQVALVRNRDGRAWFEARFQLD